MTAAAQQRRLPEQLTTLAKTVDVAIKALFKSRNEKPKTEKTQLLEEDESVYLTVSLNEIPQTHRTSAYRIPLPHPLINTAKDSPELCLIIKRGLAKEEAVKKKIESENIPITKVLNLTKLKSDYKTFESKRKLCDSYERFFCDRLVIPLLPKFIGNKFFGRKKIPVAIDLKRSNWKEQIEKSCGAAMFFIRTGTCSVIKVGKLSMERDEIVENVMATLNGVVDVLPDKWTNVRSVHLKLPESLALPIYPTVPDSKLKINRFGVKDGEELVKSDDDDDDDDSKSVKTKKKKGRIHEVSNVSEIRDDDEDQMNLEDDEVDGDVNGSGDKKKRKKMSRSKSAVSEKLVKKSKQENVLKLKKLKNDIDASARGGLKVNTKRRK